MFEWMEWNGRNNNNKMHPTKQSDIFDHNDVHGQKGSIFNVVDIDIVVGGPHDITQFVRFFVFRLVTVAAALAADAVRVLLSHRTQLSLKQCSWCAQ